ncbi:hypothetical protein F1640_07510 [Novosphingobium sp. NBM11]|uniref:hypothetical protein n=1 Tax=Novosphingobium sp. NBM11 TaxID=2596914 RepID=UPI00189243D4|nr:hypothetical protein [Novosphingobium sp. NBM11]MBF5089856.1 hypothetical protein [Novosphingobium sp. NBM11]
MSFRIPQDWLDSIIYLYPDIPSAEAGDETGGTGFLLGWPMGGNASCFTLWAVTNRHVIEQNHWTIRVNKKGGGFEFIDTDDRQWLFHPDSDLGGVDKLPRGELSKCLRDI